MKLKPLKNYHDYSKAVEYLDSLSNKELSEEESANFEILSVLVEHYERMLKPTNDEIEVEPIIDYIFDLVKSASKYEKPGLMERTLKLGEEYGELSAEILKTIGYKRTKETPDKIKENILLESSDCLIMIFDIMIEMGFTKQDILDMSEKQIKKWLYNIHID